MGILKSTGQKTNVCHEGSLHIALKFDSKMVL